MAAGFISTMQQVGGAFGVAVVGMFFSSLLGTRASGSQPVAARYAEAFAGAMLYNLVAVLLAALLVAWSSVVGVYREQSDYKESTHAGPHLHSGLRGTRPSTPMDAPPPWRGRARALRVSVRLIM